MKTIFFALVFLLFIGCSDQKKSVHNVSSEQVEKEVKPTANVATIEPTKEEVVEVIQETVPVPQVEEKKSLKKIEDKVKDKLTRFKDKVVAVVPNDIDEVEIYNGRCAQCHGHNAEKSALGKSQVIRGWTAQKIEETLYGYKNGTYGGPLKAMMQSQASKLTEKETKALSKYISNL